MKKKEMLPVSDTLFNECDRRVIIYRDADSFLLNREEQGDHLFVMWGRHPRYNLSDKGADSPFEPVLDADGHETGDMRVKDGIIAFPVNMYDHSGISFSLGGDPAHGMDYGGMDTTTGAAFLYVDKERYEQFCGSGSWMTIPQKQHDGVITRKPAAEDEFRAHVMKQAEGEVYELNLIEEGAMYGYRVEVKKKWTKLFDDGSAEEGYSWYDDDESCGGFLTEHANDIDFPREEGLPVFYKDDVCFFRDEDTGLGGYEYIIPEFVITKKDNGTEKDMYLVKSVTGDTPTFDFAFCKPGKAAIFTSWYEAQSIAQDHINKDEYDAYKNIIDIDKIKERITE